MFLQHFVVQMAFPIDAVYVCLDHTLSPSQPADPPAVCWVMPAASRPLYHHWNNHQISQRLVHPFACWPYGRLKWFSISSGESIVRPPASLCGSSSVVQGGRSADTQARDLTYRALAEVALSCNPPVSHSPGHCHRPGRTVKSHADWCRWNMETRVRHGSRVG